MHPEAQLRRPVNAICVLQRLLEVRQKHLNCNVRHLADNKKLLFMDDTTRLTCKNHCKPNWCLQSRDKQACKVFEGYTGRLRRITTQTEMLTDCRAGSASSNNAERLPDCHEDAGCWGHFSVEPLALKATFSDRPPQKQTRQCLPVPIEHNLLHAPVATARSCASCQRQFGVRSCWDSLGFLGL